MKHSLGFIAFLQATGLVLYCSLVGLLILKGNLLFGHPDGILGPTLFLLLFVTSATVCFLLYGGYAFLLFWEHKSPLAAVKVVIYTTLWLILYLLALIKILIWIGKTTPPFRISQGPLQSSHVRIN